jgi:diketogulonate reductase-like aldo/keto reductase
LELTFDSTVTIAPGVEMPRLGFGTYKSLGSDARDSVYKALRLGYRSVDTASLYRNEDEVGEAIRESGVPREEVFVATKVWNDEQGYQETKAALARSLRRLGTDYVDLYLVHWPNRELMPHTWRAMEELLGEGKTRAIGVCNHLPNQLEALLSVAEVPPAIDQVEFHPGLQRPALQSYLAEKGIVLEAWAPIMRGRVAHIPEIVAIARRLGATPAQVAIRWVLELGHVVIPKSVHEERIAENADVFSFELSAEDHKTLASLDRDERLGPDPATYNW